MRRRVGRSLALATATVSLLSLNAAEPPARPPDPFELSRVVNLPPFLVEEKGPPWIHGSGPGFEVLSRCDQDTTSDLVRHVYEAQGLLDSMLPVEMRVRRTFPTTLLLYPSEMAPAVPNEIRDQIDGDKKDPQPDNSGRMDRRDPRGRRREIQYFPNLDLQEPGTQLTFFLLKKDSAASTPVIFTSDAVRLMIAERLPAPPAWFTIGFSLFYEQSSRGQRSLVASPIPWLNFGDAEALRKNPDRPVWLIPMEDFFAGRRPPPGTPDPGAYGALWQSQADLFIRWAFEDPTLVRRQQLWKFVRRTSAEPATEALFRECFGMGYSDIWERLDDYLSVAYTGQLKFRPDDIPAPPDISLKPATATEVGRIKGDFERLEVQYVRRNFPQLAEKYLARSRMTLENARQRGGDDPELLAVLGLCDVDSGKPADATPLLTTAVQAHVTRPRVYYELAALRYQAAVAQSARPNGRLGKEQISGIVGPLLAGRTLEPQLLGSYLLACTVWLHSDSPLSPEESSFVGDGVRLFPRNGQLVMIAAALWARDGARDKALALIDLGLRQGFDENINGRLAHIRDLLSGSSQGVRGSGK